MFKPDTRIIIRFCNNGFLLDYDTWNKEENRWDGFKSCVYQDPIVLLEILSQDIGVRVE